MRIEHTEEQHRVLDNPLPCGSKYQLTMMLAQRLMANRQAGIPYTRTYGRDDIWMTKLL
jgi:hypothetical protein